MQFLIVIFKSGGIFVFPVLGAWGVSMFLAIRSITQKDERLIKVASHFNKATILLGVLGSFVGMDQAWEAVHSRSSAADLTLFNSMITHGFVVACYTTILALTLSVVCTLTLGLSAYLQSRSSSA